MTAGETRAELVLREGCGIECRMKDGSTRVLRRFVAGCGVEVRWRPSANYPTALELIVIVGRFDRAGRPCDETEIGSRLLIDVHTIPMDRVERASVWRAQADAPSRVIPPVIGAPGAPNGGSRIQ